MDSISEQPSIINPLPPIPAKKSTGKLIKAVIIFAVLGMIGGSTVLATRIWDPFWSPFRPSPKKILTLMFEKMQAVKSSHIEMKINVEMKSPNPGKLAISLSGDSDINNPKEIKSETNLELSFIGQMNSGIMENNSLKAKIKIIGQERYFNISELNIASLNAIFTMMGIDLGNLTGSWIKFPAGNQSVENAQEVFLSEQMQKIISESQIYVVKKQMPDQKIDGQKMYHYLLAIDNEKTAQLTGDLIAEATNQSNPYQQEIIGIMGVGAIKGMMLEFLDKIGEINAEFFIGKDDNLLHGFKMEKNIDLNKINEKMEGVYNINFETTNSKFNQPVKIEAVLEYIDLEELFPLFKSVPFYGSILGTEEQ
ncbi:hypothetical protein KKC00_01000 [Patescibacteria group bacterium]|nr:hypothetical protein [Patescibacteria group bacterium]